MNKIHQLVVEGIRNLKEMQRALRVYVKNELFDQARRNQGDWGGGAAPQIFATLHFSWTEKNSVKVKK